MKNLEASFEAARNAREESWNSYMSAIKLHGLASPVTAARKAANKAAGDVMRAAESALSDDGRTPDEKLLGAIFGPKTGDK